MSWAGSARSFPAGKYEEPGYPLRTCRARKRVALSGVSIELCGSSVLDAESQRQKTPSRVPSPAGRPHGAEFPLDPACDREDRKGSCRGQGWSLIYNITSLGAELSKAPIDDYLMYSKS